ncbi:MAG: efflux RND transporter permease subunit [Maricaulaceae bacterium]
MIETNSSQHRGLIGWWARNGVAANLLMVGCFIGGLMAYFQLERETFPAFPWNGASVSVNWPGASPQDVEEQVIVRIEEALADLDGVERMTSTAWEGSGSVNIESQRGYDMSVLLDEIGIRVDSINNLPQDAFRPQIRRWRANNQFMGIAVHGNVDLRTLKRVADQVRDEVALLPGASQAEIWATLDEEVSIEVSEDALRRYGLTFLDVAEAVRNTSTNLAAGSVRTQVGEVAIQARNLADTQTDFENIVVRQEEGGAAIRVRDVATVKDGFEDANLRSNFNGEPMAIVALLATEKMNVVETSEAVKTYIQENSGRLPGGVNLTMWWDDSVFYAQRMETISKSALLGLAMVLVVLILFLRPTVALWVTIGIATAFAGGLAVLPYIGVSLNMLSLFAFLLVIGIVVDDAIIVGENIHNEVESGRRKGLDASIIGTQLVAKPVVFAVVTTMMAFAPWMLLSGPEVQFTKQIALVIVAALAFSLIESLLILPAHLAHMKPQNLKARGANGAFLRFQRKFADSLVRFARTVYKPIVEACVRLRYVTVAFFVTLFVLAIGVMQNGYVAFNFMPEVENEFVQVNITFPQGTPFERVSQVQRQLERAQVELREEYRERFPGAGEMVETTNAIASEGQIEAWMGLAPPERRPGRLPTKEVADRLRELLGPIPDAEDIRLTSTLNNQEPGIQFAISASDFGVLREAADALKAQLAEYSDVYDIVDNLTSSADEARIALKPGAESLGLTLADVSRQVRQAFFGEEVQRLPREGEDVRVMVRYPVEARRSLDTLQSFRVRTPDGREIPLAAVADVTFEPGVNRINRRERLRAVQVSAEVFGDGRGQIMEDLEANFFPEFDRQFPEVTRGAIGEAEGQQEFLQEVTTLQIIMFGMMYALLAIAFRSYWQPILVMTAIPFALVGAVIGHLIFGVPLALFSFFGIGAAAGVVVNDNLVLIDFVNRLRREGLGAFQALVEAGVARFRPILLTSVTTFIGILPMIFEPSTQAQFLKPMVISLGFAVIFALFLTLLFVPALYAVGADVSRFFRGLWTGDKQPPVGSSIETGVVVTPEGVETAHGRAPAE